MLSQGYCVHCRTTHALPQGGAREACLKLMERLQSKRHIQFESQGEIDPDLGTDYLFGKARGKMFGALVGVDRVGEPVTTYAFSGQYNGRWSVPGWVDPVFSPDAFDGLTTGTEREIKKMGAQIAKLSTDDPRRIVLKKKRKVTSQELMRKIFSLYSLRNFMGAEASLLDISQKSGLPPTGTGDCCAPKLLHHAAINNIQPTGMAEFYWGLENSSGTRKHGEFYAPCHTKCSPILGFLLCGIST